MININSNKVARSILVVLLGVFLGGGLPTWVNAEPIKKKVNTNIFGVAIKGYDAVAYFTEGRAVKGTKKFSYNWNDAKWYFASGENRSLFAADPEQYAPQYGGY
jgi:YHS domain-containing protein